MMKKAYVLMAGLGMIVVSGCANETKEAPPAAPEPAASAAVETPAVISLCQGSEQVLFNCMIADAGKLLSVCGSADLSANRGYLQYRYGANAQAVELSYPKDQSNTQAAFSLKSGQLSFKNGGIGYQVDGQGVKTTWPKAPENNKDLRCSGDVVNNLSQLGVVLP